MKMCRKHRTSLGSCALAGILFSFGPNLLDAAAPQDGGATRSALTITGLPASEEMAGDSLATAGTVGGRFVEAGRSDDAIPEGLTHSDWQGIRQEYERHRHAAVAVEGGFRARNSGQQWLAHFDGRGLAVEPEGAGWRWGLELQSYGFPGHERAVSGQAKVTAQNDRVTYDWGAGLREWFVNDRGGLEHGFTLGERPTGASDTQLGAGDWLELRLAVRGGLRPQGHVDGRGVSFVDDQGRAVVHYTGLKVWDADQRELPARLDADATGLRLAVDERQARYPLTIDPTAQQAYLKASNTDFNDFFGASVAVSGDTVVVGARQEESNATGVNGNQGNNSAGVAGAAYIFVRDGGGVWNQQAYLKASNTDLGDFFGVSVAVSGGTVVVGSAEDSNATGVNGNQGDNSADDAGAAYVFVRDGGGVWSQQAYLKASNTGANDVFGGSVAVSGDTVVVGAWLEDSNATGVNGDQSNNSAMDSGAAYVFVRNGTTWNQQAYLKASNSGVFDFFGSPVTVSGDTVVVGANYEDSNATGVNGNQGSNSALDSGAAYVFVRNGSIWTQQAYLKASNTGANDGFGGSVAVSGDTVVVGAFSEDSNATGVNGNQVNNSADSAGAAYVFVRIGTTWSQQAYLKAANTGADDWFGISVAVSGDTVVVGAWLEDSNATGVNGNQGDNSAPASGAAYVFLIGPVVCGDGILEGIEQCDDGNAVSGDCCSSTCQFESAATVCRPSASICDDEELCDGAGNCPADEFQPNTVECRASTSECDAAENCTGSSADCPADELEPAGTPCDDGDACTTTDTCVGLGNCTGQPLNCDDGLFCTTDACNPAFGCGAVSTCPPAIDGCVSRNDSCDEDNDVCVDRADDTQCDDADACNGAETCDLATGDCLAGTPPGCANGDGCCPPGCTNATDDDCLDTVIPTMSEWGLTVLALLLLVGTKLYLSRRAEESA